MTDSAQDIARERQLDWLLEEALADDSTANAAARPRPLPASWLAAATALFAVGVAIAVSVLHDPALKQSVQEPVGPTWFHVYDVDGFAAMPADVVNVKLYDFDDRTLAEIGRFPRIERLDVSGMRPDANGVSTMVQITDDGVLHVRSLLRLRELSLAGCQRITGSTLKELRALPLLESLDLTGTSVASEGLRDLPLLPSLRKLSLDHCLSFHGKSLADIARIPGLRNLSLAGCATVSADDAKLLAKAHGLRSLDLTDCMGSFRGQTAVLFDDVTNGVQDNAASPPVQDGVGITDEAVLAFGSLPLEHLVLSGCWKLTDAIGPALRRMPGLRRLGIAGLPQTTGKLLAALPEQLEMLHLADNKHYRAEQLAELTRFNRLRSLDITGLTAIDDALLQRILQDKRLVILKAGSVAGARDGRSPAGAHGPRLTSASAAVIAEQRELIELHLAFSSWLDGAAGRALATMPKLRHLDCRSAWFPTGFCSGIASSSTLRSISFVTCSTLELEGVRALGTLPLAELDLYATKLDDAAVRKLAERWPTGRVRLPSGSLYGPVDNQD